VTNQPTSGSDAGGAGEKRASQFTEPLRQLGAFALLGANGLFLVLGFFRLLIADDWADSFAARSATLYGVYFVGLVPVLFPLLAVLLATHVRPAVPQSRLITLTALIEYLVSAVLGAITFVGAFANDIDNGEPREIFENLLTRLAWAGLLVLAGLAVYRVWRGVYAVAKPAPTYYSGYPQGYGQPGSYQAGYAQPGAHSQQSGYPSQGTYPPPGYGRPSGPSQPGYAAPGRQGYSAPPPSYPPEPQSYPGQGGWPSVPPPPAPNPPGPTSAPPVSSTPPGQVPPDAPTQQIR
jgi:hypothetical protein